MSFNFSQPLPTGPTAITPVPKDAQIAVAKLTFADFTTGSPARLVLVLPSDASIVSLKYWKKTAFSGNGVTAVTLSVGTPAAATNFVSAADVNTSAAGTEALLTPVTNIMQDYQAGPAPDIQIQVTGTATTGNPTAGELYLIVEFVR